MFNYAKDLLINFNYSENFTGVPNTDGTKYIENYNVESLKKSIFIANESEDVTSIFINYPALLLRKKSMLYPDGRTSYRFKRALRKKVTIIDKAAKTDQQPSDNK